MLGLFAPAVGVVMAVAFGWLPKALAPALVVASTALSAARGRYAGLSSARERDH